MTIHSEIRLLKTYVFTQPGPLSGAQKILMTFRYAAQIRRFDVTSLS
jgi:hypothetical protein